VAPLGSLKVSNSEVYVAFARDMNGSILSAFWNGTSWSAEQPVSDVDQVTGLTIFLDGGRPLLAAGFSECSGSGGCDRYWGVTEWIGSTFDDPYYSPIFASGGRPPGAPTSAVTVGGIGHLFVGARGYSTEPDIWDEVLEHASGPF
jgi:hypothetical protein